jgi:hypothetical protein
MHRTAVRPTVFMGPAISITAYSPVWALGRTGATATAGGAYRFRGAGGGRYVADRGSVQGQGNGADRAAASEHH